MLMETVFLTNEAERLVFLQQTMRSFACDYICIWSYLPQPSNFLFFLDGVYREMSNRTSSSSGMIIGRTLFEVYRGLLHDVDAGRIPGFAFKNKLTYMELTLHDVQRLVSNDLQLQFYQEAKIQNVVFMGCGAGEIELGFSNDNPQVNMEMEIRSLISSCFSHRFRPQIDRLPSSSQPTDQNQPLSSSSPSIRSQLSVDSIEQYSQVLFNPQASLKDEELIPKQALNNNNIEFHTKEIEDAEMAKAILAVLSSSSSPSANSLPSQSTLNKPTSAFSSYRSRPSSTTSMRPFQARTRSNHNMFKRAVLLFRKLSVIRRQELLSGVNGNQAATPTQLHHMISERRRREKLNESFQALRSLLPPGSKKDKASVLSITTEYLSKLKSQVEELRRRNQALEDRVSNSGRKGCKDLGFSSPSHGRTTVEISQVASTSTLPEERFLDLRVAVRGSDSSMLVFVHGMLEFLKRRPDVRLWSIDCNEMMVESNPMHGIVMKLKIEGGEFEESNFEEAVKRVVDELSTR